MENLGRGSYSDSSSDDSDDSTGLDQKLLKLTSAKNKGKQPIITTEPSTAPKTPKLTLEELEDLRLQKEILGEDFVEPLDPSLAVDIDNYQVVESQ